MQGDIKNKTFFVFAPTRSSLRTFVSRLQANFVSRLQANQARNPTSSRRPMLGIDGLLVTGSLLFEPAPLAPCSTPDSYVPCSGRDRSSDQVSWHPHLRIKSGGKENCIPSTTMCKTDFAGARECNCTPCWLPIHHVPLPVDGESLLDRQREPS